MKGKFLSKWIFLAVALSFTFALTFANTPTATAAKAINIGYTTDFSGPTAMFGVTEAPVVKMVVEEVNAAGGLNGRPINLIVLDNKGDVATMMGHLKMFKDRDRCVAVLQGVASALGIAAKKWTEENHIPIMSPDSGSDALIQKEGKAWWFRTAWPMFGQAGAAITRVADLGYKKMAFGGTTLALGDQTLGILEELAPTLGVKMVATSRCEPKTKDLTIQAKQLKDSGAEAVILGDYEAEIGVWARAFKSLGWKPYVIGAWGTCTINAVGMYPPSLFEGWETHMMVDDTKPLVKEVWDKSAKYTGKRVDNELRPRTYDAIMLTLEAIKVSGNPDDPEAIREGFYKMKDFPIATGLKECGHFEIGRNHLIGARGAPVYRITGGKAVKAK